MKYLRETFWPMLDMVLFLSVVVGVGGCVVMAAYHDEWPIVLRVACGLGAVPVIWLGMAVMVWIEEHRGVN